MDIQRKKTKKKNALPVSKTDSFLHTHRIALRTLGIIWIVGLAISSLSLTYSIIYADETIPGTQLGGVKASSLSRQELQDRIRQDVATWQSKPWTIQYKNKNFTASASELGLTFLPEATFTSVWASGHHGAFFADLGNQISALAKNNRQSLAYSIDEEILHDFLAKKLGDTLIEPVDAKLSFTDSGAIQLTPSKLGRKMDLALLRADVEQTLLTGSAPTISLQTFEAEPRISSNVAKLIQSEVVRLTKDSFILRYQDEDWTIEPKEMQSWISFVPADIQVRRSQSDAPGVDMHLQLTESEQPEVSLTDVTSGLVNTLSRTSLLSLAHKVPAQQQRMSVQANIASQFGMNEALIRDIVFLAPVLVKKDVADSFDVITKDIDIKGKNARLGFVDGKIIVKEPSQNGRAVDRDKAIGDILNAVQNHISRDIALVVTESRAAVTEDNFEELGIKELISQGESDFVGSHASRIHNVMTAMEHFDGALIAPGEEFSFVELLGDVDASTGYLPELVIKGNKITKEFGGGVCQVSSTVFRAAVYAGLDITERRNHSFVVSYYGEPGRDATIYIPHPDLKFINNTPGYILMQPHVEGTKLTFDFFGTSDGREVKTEGPFIYDRRAGNAMKASWTQIVMRDGKEVSRETYLSNYKPVTDFTRE